MIELQKFPGSVVENSRIVITIRCQFAQNPFGVGEIASLAYVGTVIESVMHFAN